MNNLLNLSNPDEINCQLLSYSRGHSEMYIEIDLAGEIQYIFLDGVKYFAGPNHWQGANFRLGTDEEFNSIAQSFELLRWIVLEGFRDRYSLYLVRTHGGIDIKIIGSKERLFLVKVLPEHLYGLRD